MHLSGKVTAKEVKDIGTLVRSKWYWPHLLIKNLHGLLFLAVLLWATIAGAIAGEREHWRARVAIVLVVAAVFGWALFSARRSRKRQLTALNAGLPDHIDVDVKGIETHNANGATSFRPWSAMRGWRSRETVILLDLVETKSFLILPLTELTSSDAAVLRGMLTSQLGTEIDKR